MKNKENILNHKKFIIAPSLLSARLDQLSSEVKKVEQAGAEWLHIDVMDGHFVPNLSFGPQTVQHLSQVTALPLDVHLMVQNPQNHFKSFIQAGASSISVHFEVLNDFFILDEIKKYNVFSGLAVKPQTPIESVFPYLKNLDFILIMTVEPGFSGQKFIRSAADKVQKVRRELDRWNYPTKIEVDGGVNDQTIRWLEGAQIFVAGHYIFKNQNYHQAISRLKDIAQEQKLNE